MRQLIQSVKTGEARVEELPAPGCGRGGVLVATACSLVSAGTERMVVDFAEKSLVQKARSRPDLVRQVLDKARREGVLTALEAVRNKMDQPMALGYSCAGTLAQVGAEVEGLRVGDRVACAGGGYASHAEVVFVPRNLVVKVPDGVDLEAAAFTTLGAIALQGIRLAEVKLGEVAAVLGLGLLGQLAVQMLKAAGCAVVGMDPQPQRAELARSLGADAVATTPEELEALCLQASGGHGADAVLITADTRSNQPVETAGQVARRKGVVVAVGAVGMTLPRKVYYEKELDFRISCSYGPGRYDPTYEEKGQDYPYAYVRWTEQRNMQAFLQLLEERKVDVGPLITHRYPIEEAPRAYQTILGKTGEPFLGVLLTYPDSPDLSRAVTLDETQPTQASRASDSSGALPEVALGVLGAGNFANAALLPALRRVPGLRLVGIASGGGLSGHSTGKRFGFAYCTTDSAQVLEDPAINTVAVLTRHHLHAPQVIAALEAGKSVFVEKPLCLTEEELSAVCAAYEKSKSGSQGRALALMVGYNRRFAPMVVELKEHLRSVREPLVLSYRVNAGVIPHDHWVHDPAQGGGRLMGEGCHFIDLLIHLAGDTVWKVTTRSLPDSGRYSGDNLVVLLEFRNGSLGTVLYTANGDKGFSKEALEVFGGGLSARLEDYRELTVTRGSARLRQRARLRQDKGHRGEWEAFARHLTTGGPPPIPFEELVHSTRVTLAAERSRVSGEPETLEVA